MEAMAFDQLEPMGALPQLHAFGQVCAVIGNVNRGKDSKPFSPEDFFPALAREVGKGAANDEPILLDDPEAQAALIKRSIFGVG